MENKKLKIMNDLFDELVLETKLAFLEKFSYLEITETTASSIIVNEIMRKASDTDGSILMHIKSHVIVPFHVLKPLLLDRSVAFFNYKIRHVYTDGRVSLSLHRFYYDTEKKTIFGM